MSATVKDLARETGLGLATISSYLNGGNVREKNRLKIEAAIKKYDFQVNEAARSLKTRRTMTIGVVVPELNSNFFANIIAEAEDILRHHGYSVIVSDCRSNPAYEREVVEFLARKRVDGIINAPTDNTGTHLTPFFNAQKPVVLIDRKLDGTDCDCVYVDNTDALRQAVARLAKNGHKVIGYIGGPPSVYTSRQRLKGFVDSLREFGLEAEESLLIESDYTIQGGRRAMLDLVRENPRMTAAITINDDMTIGSMIAFNELGLRVPDDISLIGFDHLDFASACQPRLSIISQPTKEIARRAAALILKRLCGDNEENGDVRLPCSLTEGNSIKSML